MNEAVLVVQFLKMERKDGCRVISACGGLIRTRESGVYHICRELSGCSL